MTRTLVLLTVLFLSSCGTALMEQMPLSSLRSQTPVTRTVPLQGTPQDAYRQATAAFATMGGRVTLADAQTRAFTGIVHNAVQMQVTVDPQSVVTVTGQILPGKLVLGSFSEVDDYVALLTREATHAH